MIVCGREVSPETLAQLQAAASALSQRQRARRLCELAGWMGPSGGMPLSVARQAVARLERVGKLPPRSSGPVRVGGPSTAKKCPEPVEVRPIDCTLEELGPIEVVLVGSRSSRQYRIWKALLEQYHYLGAGPLCGAQLRYLVGCPQGWVGALAFSAAARRLRGRDQWIQWSEEARRENLPRVVNNSRLLIAEPVKVPNLASRVLGLASGRLVSDWRKAYGYEPVLLESFVDWKRFAGTCYQAANWQAIDISSGRGRQDRDHTAELSKKVLWVYPLVKNFRAVLCAPPQQRRLFHAPRPAPALPAPPQDWAEAEISARGLPQRRLRRRAVVLLRDFFARPQAQIPQACGSRAKTKAAYRFFDHRQVSMQNLLRGHYEASHRRAAEYPVVLAVQDTTELNYSAHRATEQLGPIGEKKTQQVGLLVHDTMLYNLEGTPLGLLDVQCWVRDEDEVGQSEHCAQRPIEQKESYKWLKSFSAASRLQAQCPHSQVVSLGDRESDVYELFVAAQNDPHRTKLLVRAFQDRKLAQGAHLWSHLLGQTAVASMKLKVPRKKKQPARTAVVEIRYGPIELVPPQRKHLHAVKLWAVSVVEVEPPVGVEAVEWMLLTNMAVESTEAALEKVQWYCLRFQIEVYHRTLKSGCKIEERQLGSAERIESCLAMDLIVAWRIVHLTKLGRETPEVPCTVFFEEAQWQAILFFMTKKLPPKQPPSLRTIQLLVAQLGGFLGRKCDGSPGTKSMWLGLQRTDDITEMWRGIKSLNRASLLTLLDSS